MRYALTMIILMALWLLMSGIYKPLIVGFGVASVIMVGLIGLRMDRQDRSHPDMRLSPLRFVGYFMFLLKEIAKANWAVTKLILAPRAHLRQHLFHTPITQKSDIGQVTFANSITLTPGTITVETEPGRFLVHALDYSAGVPDELADMDRRISHCEAL